MPDEVRQQAERERSRSAALARRLMADQPGRRRFGNVRRLPSGRWQARYIGPDGLTRTAPNTFATERQAQKWLTLVEGDILNMAVKEDEIIRQNPCRIKGYDRYHTPERPTATIPQVFALADAMPARFSALVIVGAFSSLRWGELAELRRRDVDLETGIVGCPASSPSSSAGWRSARPSPPRASGSSRSPPSRWKRSVGTWGRAASSMRVRTHWSSPARRASTCEAARSDRRSSGVRR
jgi:hypothetical protein